MDFDTIYNFLVGLVDKWPWVAYVIGSVWGLGSLITCAKAWIKKSVTQVDDAWLAKVEAKPALKWIIDFVEKFSLVKSKAELPPPPAPPAS